jgi:hypothetical protein
LIASNSLADSLGWKAALEERRGALERCLQAQLVLMRQVVVLANAALGVVEQRAHGRGTRRLGAELGRIEVEVETEHNRLIQPQLRESAQLVAFGSGDLHALPSFEGDVPCRLLPGSLRCPHGPIQEPAAPGPACGAGKEASVIKYVARASNRYTGLDVTSNRGLETPSHSGVFCVRAG